MHLRLRPSHNSQVLCCVSRSFHVYLNQLRIVKQNCQLVFINGVLSSKLKSFTRASSNASGLFHVYGHWQHVMFSRTYDANLKFASMRRP